MLWSGAKGVGQEVLRAGGTIWTDIAENKSPDVIASDMVSRRVTASTQNLVQKVHGDGRKRKAASGSIHKTKKSKLTKETSSPKSHQSPPSHVRGNRRVHQFCVRCLRI
jgi:hypothetical protein